jgi:hypothetical protein
MIQKMILGITNIREFHQLMQLALQTNMNAKFVEKATILNSANWTHFRFFNRSKAAQEHGTKQETQVVYPNQAFLFALLFCLMTCCREISTCLTSISVWNFLAATPDVVNIEAPLLYLVRGKQTGMKTKYHR